MAAAEFRALGDYLGSQILFGLKFKTIAPQPAFQDYLQRLMARPAWQRAIERGGPFTLPGA